MLLTQAPHPIIYKVSVILKIVRLVLFQHPLCPEEILPYLVPFIFLEFSCRLTLLLYLRTFVIVIALIMIVLWLGFAVIELFVWFFEISHFLVKLGKESLEALFRLPFFLELGLQLLDVTLKLADTHAHRHVSCLHFLQFQMVVQLHLF